VSSSRGRGKFFIREWVSGRAGIKRKVSLFVFARSEDSLLAVLVLGEHRVGVVERRFQDPVTTVALEKRYPRRATQSRWRASTKQVCFLSSLDLHYSSSAPLPSPFPSCWRGVLAVLRLIYSILFPSFARREENFLN